MEENENGDEAEEQRDRSGRRSHEASIGRTALLLRSDVENETEEKEAGPNEKNAVCRATVQKKRRQDEKKEGRDERMLKAIKPAGPPGVSLGEPMDHNGQEENPDRHHPSKKG